LKFEDIGRVAEWFKAPVLKTGVPARVPWVRIPPLPPYCNDIIIEILFFRADLTDVPVDHEDQTEMARKPRTPVDNPFPNRTEDVLNKGIRAAVGALPVLGSGLTEFLGFVVGGPAQERRDDFMKATLERLLELESQFDQLDREALRNNEQFHASFLQATRLSTQTADEEKRRLLQNAIINSAILNIDETLRQILMQFLERITPAHAAVLNLFDNPAAAPAAERVANVSMGGLHLIVEAAVPDLKGNRPIADRIVADLENMGLVSGASLNVTMTGSGLLAQRSTPLGRSFLQFISDPAER
jgi:hypothetical protein